ncbi:hypothetical protein ENSA5_63340 [Enhygromyxa salina]|uniref:Lipoprotein n=1 Tax=Enhygromyxa salina TaxID=215803 RepID=A0A2S9XCM8_9BACT|nr:hypothetical protein [Enhygromyxa salina]PRP90606.1 hypothetical protein ENSA5_63340 [Enhygromyxa salina]
MLDLRPCSVALLALGASGCSDTTPRSCDLNTSSLVMRGTVSDFNNGVEVEIEFETEVETEPGTSGTTLELCPDSDQLEVNGVEAEPVQALGHLYYVVEFAEPEASYEISLERKDHESVSMIVEMPPSFEITAPAVGAESSRGEPLAVEWTPSWPEQLVELKISDKIGSSCIEGLGVEVEVDDTGSYDLAANTLVGGGAVSNCEVSLSLTRLAEADYPAALAEGGKVSAVVKRRRPFTSVE